MRLPILLLTLSLRALAATPYGFGTTLRLDNGAESLLVTHTVDGVEQSYVVRMSLPLRGATYQKVTAWGSKYYVAGKSETTCAAPCNVQMPLHYGPPKLMVTRYDASSNVVGAPGIVSIPQYIPPPVTGYTMPIEMIGFEGLERSYAVNARASADLSGTERLYLRIHRPAYEGKAQVRVNGGAWTDIKHANVTRLGTHANWGSVASLDFGQSLLEISMTLSASQVTTGTNTISFRFAKEWRDQSGFRIVEMNLMQPDINVFQVAVSGSTVTVDTATPHGYSTGDDVRIEAYPGIAWRVNGAHTITVIDSNTFTFAIPETDGKQAGTKTYAGVKVAKLIVDVDDFTEENVNSWTAPTGSNAPNGATRWAANDLLSPEFPGQAITASCAECHAKNGLDLKYFNYSNHSIIVRSMFHGLTEQQGKDIAAYIRGNPSSNPGRPYNAAYQPCPAAVTASAYDWAGACTYRDVLPSNAGMIEELFGSSIEAADWNPTRNGAHFAQQRINLQMLDWNDWLPLIHPKDSYSTPANQAVSSWLYWPTSQPLSGYNDYRGRFEGANAGICPGAGCAAYMTTLSGSSPTGGIYSDIGDMLGLLLVSGLTTHGITNPCQGNPADTQCGQTLKNAANEYSKRTYSVGLWSMTKQFEVLHEFDLERYGQIIWPRNQIDRNFLSNTAFGSSFNLIKAWGNNGDIPGMFDGTVTTERVMSVIWYQYQGILNRDNNQCLSTGPPCQMFNSISPLDVPYTYGYFANLAQNQNIDFPLIAAQWVMQQFQRYRNTTPDWTGSSHGWYYNAVLPQLLTDYGVWFSWEGLPAEDRSTWRTAIIDTGYTKWTALACGDEQNGNAALFTQGMWNSRTSGQTTQMPTGINVPFSTSIANMPSLLWHAILMGRAFGVNTTTLDRLVSCGSSWWMGPNSTLSSDITSSQTAITLASDPGSRWNTGNFRFRVDSEDIDCSTRSGATLSGCTRGANGTAAVSHSSGAAAQIQIRWNDARIMGTCTLDANDLTVNPGCYSTPKP
jgi:hypothetical protein